MCSVLLFPFSFLSVCRHFYNSSYLRWLESEEAAASTNLGHKRASLAGEVRRVLPGIEVADARAVKVLRRRVVQQVDDDARPTFVHVRRQRHLLAALLALAAVERRFALKAVAGLKKWAVMVSDNTCY